MKFVNVFALGLALALSSAAIADDKPADPKAADSKPADPKAGDAKSDVKGVRLTKPFSDLKDLTPDQISKIKAIHKKYLEDKKTLDTKQLDDEMAVLTDDQKKEAEAIEKKPKPAKSGEKVGDKPTTDTKATGTPPAAK